MLDQPLTWTVDGRGPADVQIYLIPTGDETGLNKVQLFFSVPAATGIVHTDMKTGPLTTCRQNLLKDDPFTVSQDHLGAGGPADPNDPNNLEGEETQLSPDKTITTTIKWKLTRVVAESANPRPSLRGPRRNDRRAQLEATQRGSAGLSRGEAVLLG